MRNTQLESAGLQPKQRFNDKLMALEARYLLETGLLFELNRRFLHPLHLVLSIVPDDQGEDRLELSAVEEPHQLIFEPQAFEKGLACWRECKPEFEHLKVCRQKKLGYVVQGEK